MEKEFVPYELAVKLKELGFDEPCFGEYRQWDGNKPYLKLYQDIDVCSTDSSDYQYTVECLTPLWQQAVDFIMSKIDFKNLKTQFTLTIKADYYLDEYSKENNYTAVEIACGKQSCLEKLIEIMKENLKKD